MTIVLRPNARAIALAEECATMARASVSVDLLASHAKSRPARTSVATMESAWMESANVTPDLRTQIARFNFARRTATTMDLVSIILVVCVILSGLASAVKKRYAHKSAVNMVNVFKVCAIVHRNGPEMHAASLLAQVVAILAANASKVPASASLDGAEKHAISKNALDNVPIRPTESAIQKRSNVPARRDGLAKTVARKPAQKTAMATECAKTVSVSAKICGRVLRASSQLAPTHALATVCASVTDASVIQNTRVTTALYVNAPMHAADVASASKRMTLNASAQQPLPAKIVGGKLALKGATPLMDTANCLQALKGKKSASVFVQKVGLDLIACPKGVLKVVSTENALMENASVPRASWVKLVIWLVALITVTTTVSAILQVVLLYASATPVIMANPAPKRTAPINALVMVYAKLLNARAQKVIAEKTAQCVNAHLTI